MFSANLLLHILDFLAGAFRSRTGPLHERFELGLHVMLARSQARRRHQRSCQDEGLERCMRASSGALGVVLARFTRAAIGYACVEAWICSAPCAPPNGAPLPTSTSRPRAGQLHTRLQLGPWSWRAPTQAGIVNECVQTWVRGVVRAIPDRPLECRLRTSKRTLVVHCHSKNCIPTSTRPHAMSSTRLRPLGRIYAVTPHVCRNASI